MSVRVLPESKSAYVSSLRDPLEIVTGRIGSKQDDRSARQVVVVEVVGDDRWS